MFQPLLFNINVFELGRRILLWTGRLLIESCLFHILSSKYTIFDPFLRKPLSRLLQILPRDKVSLPVA